MSFFRKPADASFICAIFASVLCLTTAFADDTEVFFGQVDPDLDIFPNVLFVLDTSGSMNSTDGESQTRLERMKEALETIIDNATNVNVGVMRFNGGDGGGAVLFPVTPIDKELCQLEFCGEISAGPRVSLSEYDSEEKTASGEVVTDDTVLALGNDGAESQVVGLHFDDLEIPQGAKITSAKLEFTADSLTSADANFKIVGELTPNAIPFTDTQNDISSRADTTASVNWDVTETWEQGLVYQSDQIDTVLQEIVDQTDWCGANSVSIKVSGTGQRFVRSYDQSPSEAPVLKFTYDSSNIPAGGGCIAKSHVSAIASSSDDAEEQTNRRNRILTSNSDLDMLYAGNQPQTIGLRFTEIKIPQGALITDATIEFKVQRQGSGDVSLTVHGEATGHASTFNSTRGDISGRDTTSASVAWNNVPHVDTGSEVVVENLTSIAQEIVNRSDWSTGNAMAYIFSGQTTTGTRSYETFDSEIVNAAKLRIEYRATSDNGESTYITARDKLKETVNNLTATGGTPIVDAYFEAASYFRGSSVDYGTQRGYYTSQYHRVSVPESYTGGTVNRWTGCTDSDLDDSDCKAENISGSPVYISPFDSSCQTNHIVFLSDGAAWSNSAADKVRSLTGNPTCMYTGTSSWASGNQECGVELAEWLVETDHSSAINGNQNIATYTIGFNFNSDFLEIIANAGGGDYFQADTSAQLVDVFQSILGDVLSVDTSFVAPGATVNQFNRLTHRDDIYFALFKPDERPTWAGNLKRYEIGSDGDDGVTIVDVNGDKAVNEETGFFDAGATSWWSDETDGSSVNKGGAAAEMLFTDADPRRVFTYIGDNESIPLTGIDLTFSDQAVSEHNDLITLDHLGIASEPGTDAERDDFRTSLLQWGRGLDLLDDDEDDETDDWRMHMGDPMHARPVILNYADGDDSLTTIFVGTNEGYLHAIERDDGHELYSFIPQELLSNLNIFWDNQSSDAHPYGLDGSLSVWMTDEDQDVTIDPGEKAFLYTGMRRGGSNYYALDVADRLDPKLAWVIGPTTPGFEEMGQTWSKMTPTKIRYEDEERDVLIFGAGYDENQDWTTDSNGNMMPRTTDSVGRGFYIVDAETGELIYSALGANGASQKFDDMEYSMPADLQLVDTDFDGFADQIYATDVGGQIWRFDFEKYHSSQGEPLLTGGVIADLSGSGIEGERRFYYKPDVAMISDAGERFMSVSVGSGWRAHPLDTEVDDKFYMIKSPSIFSAPNGYGKTTDGGQSYTPITETDLVDVTNTLTAGANNYGWLYDLGSSGEKVLGNSVTAENQVIFTTYRPDLDVGVCATAIGGGSVYVLNIINGAPTIDLNNDGVIDEDDREKELAHGGIPPEPALLITEKGIMPLVGPEQPFELESAVLTKRSFWSDTGEESD